MQQHESETALFIVGTGPGGPDYLTLQAAELIRSAYDCRMASPGARIVAVDRYVRVLGIAAIKPDRMP